MSDTPTKYSEDLLTQLLRNSNIRMESLGQKSPVLRGYGTKKNLKGAKNSRSDLLEPTVKEEQIPPPPSSKVLSTAVAPEGGTIVSVRDHAGRLKVRIEYDRDQMLHLAKSPFAVVPPASIRDMVMNTPEMLSTFPVRH